MKSVIPILVALLTFAAPVAFGQQPVEAVDKVEPETTVEPVDADSGSEATPPQQNFGRYEALIAGLTIFVLAVFVGFEVITKVPPTLHTPLMSGSNAISGISLVGAVIVTGAAGYVSASAGLVAVVLATINVIGGFLVTHRMLAMFAGKKKKPA